MNLITVLCSLKFYYFITFSTLSFETGLKNMISTHVFNFTSVLWHISYASPFHSVISSTISMKYDLSNFAVIFGPANLLDPKFISVFFLCNTDIPISLFFYLPLCCTAFVVFLAFDLYLSFNITLLYIFM